MFYPAISELRKQNYGTKLIEAAQLDSDIFPIDLLAAIYNCYMLTLMRDLGVRLYGDAASAFLGGPGQEGSVHLWHGDEDWDESDEERTAVAHVLKATKRLEVTDSDDNTAMLIDTDGTVRVKDGEVKSLP